MIENQLERIAVALEKLCVLVSEMPKTEAPKTRGKKEPAKKETPVAEPLKIPETTAVMEDPKMAEATKPVDPFVGAMITPHDKMAIVNTVDPDMKHTVNNAQPIMTPAETTPAAPITVEQLRAAIIEVQQKKGPAIAKKIVQETGNAPQVTKIEVAKYQMVMDACKAALL